MRQGVRTRVQDPIKGGLALVGQEDNLSIELVYELHQDAILTCMA